MRMPASTPHCPVPHNLWSATWVADAYNPPDPPVLGEISGPKQRTYFSGNGGVPIPIGTIIGDSSCITNGDSYPSSAPIGLVNGYKLNCFLQFPPFEVSGSFEGCGQITGKAFLTPAGIYQGKGQLDGSGLVVDLGRFYGKGQLGGSSGTAIDGAFQGKGQLGGFGSETTRIGPQGKGQLAGSSGTAIDGAFQGKGQLGGVGYLADVDGFDGKGTSTGNFDP